MRLLLASLLLAVAAGAQPADPTPGGTGWASPSVAFGLSIGTPIAFLALGAAIEDDDGLGAAVIAGGLLLGPSAGNVVQGDWGDALVGTGLRVAGTAAATIGFALAFDDGDDEALVTGLLIGGAAAYAGGTLYDVLTATRDRGAEPTVTVAPGGAGLAIRVGL